jgi:hypothetical protein
MEIIMRHYTEILSEFVFSLKYGDLPRETVEMTKNIILDWYSSTFAGMKVNGEFNAAVRSVMLGEGRGRASILCEYKGGYSETDMENLCLGREGDVALFISRSGEHKKTYAELKFAKEKGMVTIALTDAIKCPLRQEADYALCTGMEDRANIFVHRNSSALNMMVLVEVLLDCVGDRLTNKNYLDEVVSEDRL